MIKKGYEMKQSKRALIARLMKRIESMCADELSEDESSLLAWLKDSGFTYMPASKLIEFETFIKRVTFINENKVIYTVMIESEHAGVSLIYYIDAVRRERFLPAPEVKVKRNRDLTHDYSTLFITDKIKNILGKDYKDNGMALLLIQRALDKMSDKAINKIVRYMNKEAIMNKQNILEK